MTSLKDLYGEFKDALTFFGLGWGSRGQVQVSGKIELRHRERSITLDPGNIPTEEEEQDDEY